MMLAIGGAGVVRFLPNAWSAQFFCSVGRFCQGTDGNDVMTGDHTGTVIDAYAGDDVVNAGAGDDRISGMDVNDNIGGGAGNDYIYGGDGNDSLGDILGSNAIIGGYGSDYIASGRGDDWIYGGPNADIIYAGAGDDHIWHSAAESGPIGSEHRPTEGFPDHSEDYIDCGPGNDEVTLSIEDHDRAIGCETINEEPFHIK
jgi:Ca2+-binding RTX toxin-like protein